MRDSYRPQVLILGPARTAVAGGGVSTHLNRLFDSNLAKRFRLSQYQVGSAGRGESRLGLLLRVLTTPWQFVARLLRDRPDIVHINTSLTQRAYWRDLAYLGAAKILGRRIVYQVHGGPFPRDFFAKSRLLSALLRGVLSLPDVVVLISAVHRRAYAEFAPAAHLSVVAYGVEIADVGAKLEGYDRERPLEIVYIGRFIEAKGIFDIVEAVRVLRCRGIVVRLRFAGSGPEEHALRSRIAGAGLHDRIQLLEPVFGTAKEDLWRSANVLALPSYTEGLPLALLESMSAGTVPVVTPVGGIPDAVQDGVHGLFVAPRSPIQLADALQQLHEDRERLQRMARAARRQVIARYSADRCAAGFQSLYAAIAPEATRHPSAD